MVSANYSTSPSSIYRYVFNESGDLVELQSLRTGGGNGQALTLSNGGESIVLAAGGGNGPDYSIYDYSSSDLNNVKGEFVTGPYPSGAVFSADDTLFAASNYNELVLFDAITHAEIERHEIPRCSYGTVRDVAFSQDAGMVIAKQSCGPDRDTAELHFFPAPKREQVADPVVAYDSCPVYTGTVDLEGSVNLGTNVRDIIALCDGYILYSDLIKNRIHLHNVFSGETIQSYQLNAKPYEITLDSTRGKLYATHGPVGFFSSVNLDTGAVNTATVNTGAQSVAVSADDYVFVKENGGSMNYRNTTPVHVYDGSTLTLLNTVDDIQGKYISFNDTTQRLITSDFNYYFNPLGNSLVLQGPSSGGSSSYSCERVYVSGDGIHSVQPCAGREVYDYSSENPDIVFGAWVTTDYPSDAAFTPGDTYILISERSNGLLFDVQTHVLVHEFPFSECSYGDTNKVAVSHDGQSLYALTNCGFDDESAIVDWSLFDTLQ